MTKLQNIDQAEEAYVIMNSEADPRLAHGHIKITMIGTPLGSIELARYHPKAYAA